jgi:hypothetical protein
MLPTIISYSLELLTAPITSPSIIATTLDLLHTLLAHTSTFLRAQTDSFILACVPSDIKETEEVKGQRRRLVSEVVKKIEIGWILKGVVKVWAKDGRGVEEKVMAMEILEKGFKKAKPSEVEDVNKEGWSMLMMAMDFRDSLELVSPLVFIQI